ncbi:helix-turn-helix domain-containing protein [Streptomyces atratus]|uniref:Helix-turn-helix domain-containing protein n=1 Tax=Streptomyces atratus TaxID=1893 RepID=A0A1K2AWF5_STRAR|nr:DNA-binding protein [Streptomyces atratus]SFX90705.1 hypothetical protein SAMN02787144_1007317 [Streptomyces atratus]
MDTQQVSVPAHASSPVSGVVHVNTRQTSRFTIIGNHLAQHREMSLLAIGLSTYIQSLPAGARIGIKKLAERFPESEARIAAALRELETHGYLSRTRERLPNGNVVTRTCSYNQPLSTVCRHPEPRPEPRRYIPTPPAPAPAAPVPLPHPRKPLPQYVRAATALLADLHRHAPQITLTEKDVTLLAPLAVTWFERGSTPGALRHALTADLPKPLKYPAKLLRHRLTVLLPPPATPATLVDPLQNCNNCDRAFRAPSPGYCRDCEAHPCEA